MRKKRKGRHEGNGTGQGSLPAPPNVRLRRIRALARGTKRRKRILPLFCPAVGLTARETEILSLLARGRTLPYIANELFVTTGTVKTHVRHIYEKALVNNRQELLDKVEAR